MEKMDIVEKLTSLAKLDLDATKSYEEAIKKVDEADIRERLVKYMEDHHRHVRDLSDLITKYGGKAPQITTDVRGLFLGGATMLQGMMGTQGALTALQTGEKITNESYKDAVSQNFPADIEMVLNANYRDEQSHLSYVNELLASKPWEKGRAA